MGENEKQLQARYTALCAELGDCTLKAEELAARIAEIKAAVREVSRNVDAARKQDVADAANTAIDAHEAERAG